MTSLSASIHDAGESERRTDLMYCILTATECSERSNLARGICKLIQETSPHPAVSAIVEHLSADDDRTATVQRALIMAAMAHEPDFLQYALDTGGTCSSTISQFAVTVLPALIEKVLNGDMSLPDFVLCGTHAYTTL